MTGADGELRLQDGRALGYALYGAPEGRPAIYVHGFPSSRLEAALHSAAAAAAGVRLVAPDRPGFGRSATRAGRRIADWPLDVRALADHLGIRRFGLIGASCGGPYAAACAAALPDRVDSLALLASVAPFAERGLTRRQMPPLRLLFGLARLHPSLVRPLLALDARVLRADPERALRRLSRLLSPPDRELLQRREDVRRCFLAALLEAYRQGAAGAAQDAHLLAGGWGFDLGAVRAPTMVFQAGRDGHAPPEMGRWLAERIPGARLVMLPEAGHLSLICACFEQAAAAIAQA